MEKTLKSSLLFTPAAIGPVTLRNRTIRAAAFEGMCDKNSPTQQLYDYHTSVAEGGVGMTTIAYASVSRNGLSFPHQLWMRPDIIRPLRTLTDAVHEKGAKVSIQLGHCGNMSHKSIAKQIPISASSGVNIYSPTIVRGMNNKNIRDIAFSFGEAVRMARDAGFDCVEIHAGHGYLISQFLSPYTNKRKDSYGGSLDNRMKFMRMCITEVMNAAETANMGIIVKTNMRDGFKGGIEIDDGITIAKELENMGVHALVLSGGFVSKAPMYVMRGEMPIKAMTHYMQQWWLKYGVRLAGKYMIRNVPFKELYFLDDALQFRKELKLPLIYVGGCVSREGIDKVLDNGFEFVQMARALLNEPDFVNRMLNGENKCKCNHTNYCIARMYSTDMACHQHVQDLPEKIKNEIRDIEKSNGIG